MRKFVYAFAIAAVSGLTAFAASGSAAPAAPAAGGLALGGAVPVVDGNGLVHRVHGWHCSKKKGAYAGYKKRWHRHPKACRDRYDDYGDGYDYDYSYYDGYDQPYYGYYPYQEDYGYYPYRRSYAYYPYRRNYGYEAYPFFSFGFGNHGGWRGGRGDDDD